MFLPCLNKVDDDDDDDDDDGFWEGLKTEGLYPWGGGGGGGL